MEDRIIDRPVKIRYNSLTSLVPPCFCWELLGKSGSVIATVSEVSLTQAGCELKNHEALALLERNQATVTGSISEYDAGPPSHAKGLRFTALLDPSSPRHREAPSGR